MRVIDRVLRRATPEPPAPAARGEAEDRDRRRHAAVLAEQRRVEAALDYAEAVVAAWRAGAGGTPEGGSGDARR